MAKFQKGDQEKTTAAQTSATVATSTTNGIPNEASKPTVPKLSIRRDSIPGANWVKVNHTAGAAAAIPTLQVNEATIEPSG